MKLRVLVLWMTLLGGGLLAGQEVSFSRDVFPILADRCFACHGPDGEERKAKLRLDRADGPEGAYRVRKGAAAIKPGDLAASELWARVSATDEEERMPPADAHQKPLTERELDILKRWIQSGAKYEVFWAFKPPTKPALPKVKDAAWGKLPIDRFVLARMEAAGLQPAKTTDKRTLIRRLTFDLTGLPPSREAVRAFVADDRPEAYEALVDRLLAEPAYGEHMARYWMDLVRFADTNGMHKDFYRNFIAYRDWLIRSFNDNLGYDDFLKYQLAGDLYPKPTGDQLVASGFNRMHLIIDRGTALPEESFFKNVVDRVTAVGTAFMGLTVQCATCHDHKYDPFTQKDFYSLFAFFNNIDAAPETSGRPRDGLQPPFAKVPTPAQQQALDALAKAIEAEAEAEKKKALTAKRAELDKAIPTAMVMKERAQVRPTHLRKRGRYDDPGELVQRGTPGFLPPMKKTGEVASRMDLAGWFVGRRHPLTARVAVNRFWQQLLGTGLVKTSEDLGAQGEVPSHPALLDHLAVAFIESGWDVKALMKQMVMSQTYRQSSVATPAQFTTDPENRLLARGSRFRLDAEMIRDQILASSGLLVPKLYGRSVKPPQPDGLWKSVTMIGERFRADSGEDIYRRSLYTYWKRGMPPPQMTILNAPNRDACIARRERTNTSSQALLLLNEAQYLKAARALAQKTLAQNLKDDTGRLAFAYETVTAQLPDARERAILLPLVENLRAHYTAEPTLAAQLCEGLDLPADAQAQLAAWTVLVNTLYNLDITKTRE